jgi:hypothetical protein
MAHGANGNVKGECISKVFTHGQMKSSTWRMSVLAHGTNIKIKAL